MDSAELHSSKNTASLGRSAVNLDKIIQDFNSWQEVLFCIGPTLILQFLFIPAY